MPSSDLAYLADAETPIVEPPRGVRVAPVLGKGRGVFATTAFAAGDIVEVAPVLAFPPGEHERMGENVLDSYVFGWGDTVAVALGYGSIYNHAWSPNVEYRKRLAEAVIEFVALRDIAAGEELTINYASSHPERAALWSDLR